jgi:hypothetical protein
MPDAMLWQQWPVHGLDVVRHGRLHGAVLLSETGVRAMARSVIRRPGATFVFAASPL